MPPEPARMTIFATAMTSGMLLALAAHMLAARVGIDVTSAWQELFIDDAHAMHAAQAWWFIAAAGFGGSFLAGMLVQDAMRGRPSAPALRSLVAALFFALLAATPHLAPLVSAPSLPFGLGIDLAVLGLAGLTAFCGGWFSLPR
jgi:hypothetical protein